MALSKKESDSRVNILMGEVYVNQGWLYPAIGAFRAAGEEIPKAKLVKCGETCLDQGLLDDAFAAFKAAGDKAKLVKCAEAYIAQGRSNLAYKAFEAAVSLEE